MEKSSKKVTRVNSGTEEEFEIKGFKFSKLRSAFSWFFVLLTLGFLKLVFYWRPDVELKCTHRRCELHEASKLLAKDKYAQVFVEAVEQIKDFDIDELLSIEFDEDEDDELAQNINESMNDKSQEELVLFKRKILKKYGETKCIRYFTNKKCKYFWSERQKNFEKLKGLEENFKINFFRRLKGLTRDEQTARRKIYGPNSISVDLTPVLTLLFREVLSPFYIFQIFSCSLWIIDQYYYYAVCIIVISVVSIIYSLYSIRKNEKSLRNMIHFSDKLSVFRKCENDEEIYEEQLRSDFLVPGDIIEVKNMSILQCDALLLDGNVIVNESMLTGESVPITKTGIGRAGEATHEILSLKEHRKHVLFSGTQVIQTRYYANEKVKAIVLRTGFSTTKGELIRAILFPKPSEFHFNTDLYKYIAALSLIAFVGMIYTMVLMVSRKYPVYEIAIKTLDLIAIVVPPALPGALTACLIYTQNRLKKKKIYCISPNVINVCGSIDTFVFDKTGTLTEENFDLKCVLPTDTTQASDDTNAVFDKEVRNSSEFVNEKHKEIVEAMASCHTITHIEGKLCGDPLDLKVFEFTKWNLFEPTLNETSNYDMLMPVIVHPGSKLSFFDLKNPPYEVGIIKLFPFSSALQRMSVIVKALNGSSFDFYIKGSPETLASMSRPQTVPKDFDRVLSDYTRKGYRVIAIASKKLEMSYLKVQKIDREHLEKDLTLLGLIVMENPLKKESKQVIDELKAANIRCIMCTGDNFLTALNVASECGIVDENDRVINIELDNAQKPVFKCIKFDENVEIVQSPILLQNSGKKFHYVVVGAVFEVIREKFKDLFDNLVRNGTIYARMNPEQKQQLIEALQEHGEYVGMCGDGANDCGALKAANAGISLSEAEASIASPFTSKNANIECVSIVICEGRAALVTSFGLVKFICTYSLTQFITVIILYTIGNRLSDEQFLYIDLALITFLAFFFSKNEAFDRLDPHKPNNKLIAFGPIASLVFHTLLILAFQLLAFFVVQTQPWFEKFVPSEELKGNMNPYENTAIYTVSIFQYVTEAIIFSKGRPYRKNIFTNKLFMITLLMSTLSNFLLSINPYQSISDFMYVRVFPDIKFRFILIGFAVIHFFTAFIFETFIIDEDSYLSIRRCLNEAKNRRQPSLTREKSIEV